MTTVFTYRGVKIAADHDATFWHHKPQFFCPDFVDVDCAGFTGSLSEIMEQVDEWRAERRDQLEEALDALYEDLRCQTGALVETAILRLQLELQELQDEQA